MKRIIILSKVTLLLFFGIATLVACDSKLEDVNGNVNEEQDAKVSEQTTEQNIIASLDKKVSLLSLLKKRTSRTTDGELTNTEQEMLMIYDSLQVNLPSDSLSILNNFVERGGEIDLNTALVLEVPATVDAEEGHLESLQTEANLNLQLDETLGNMVVEIENIEESRRMMMESLSEPSAFRTNNLTVFSKINWRKIDNKSRALTNPDNLVPAKDLIKVAILQGSDADIETVLKSFGLKIDNVLIKKYQTLFSEYKQSSIAKSSSDGSGYSNYPLPGFPSYSQLDNGDILVARISKIIPGYFSHGGMYDKAQHDYCRYRLGIEDKEIHCMLTANGSSAGSEGTYAPDRAGYVCYDKVKVFTHGFACIRLWPIGWTSASAAAAVSKAREYYNAWTPYWAYLPYKKDRDLGYTKNMYCTRVPWMSWQHQGQNIEADYGAREIYWFCDIIYPDNIYNGCFKWTRTTCWSFLWWGGCDTKEVSQKKNVLYTYSQR